MSEVSKQSIAFVDQLRKQNPSRSSEKMPSKTSISSDVNPNRLSDNFLFIYNSVTSVLRDRGII